MRTLVGIVIFTIVAAWAMASASGCDVDLHGAFLSTRSPDDATYASPLPKGAVKIFYYEEGEQKHVYGMFLANRLQFHELLNQFAAFEETESCIGTFPVGCCYKNGEKPDIRFAACQTLIEKDEERK